MRYSGFFYPTAEFEPRLQGKTLVVPVVSVANVSQLAVDLLIASFELHRVGTFDSSFFVPVVGGREDGEEGVTTPLELYSRSDLDLAVVQQRSPALKFRKQEFINALLEFIQNSGAMSVLFLSGMDLSNRTDAQMLTPTYYIHPLNSPSLTSTPLHRLSQLPIPAYTSPVPQYPGQTAEKNIIPFIPGGGLTRRILSTLPITWSTPTASLLQFVLEGDNRADASLLATTVAKVVGMDTLIREWREPISWKHGLFGAPHDQTLYG